MNILFAFAVSVALMLVWFLTQLSCRFVLARIPTPGAPAVFIQVERIIEKLFAVMTGLFILWFWTQLLVVPNRFSEIETILILVAPIALFYPGYIAAKIALDDFSQRFNWNTED